MGHIKMLPECIEVLKDIFLKSVHSVRPANLFSNKYSLKPAKAGGREVITIDGTAIDITSKRCHVVGFGKAVLGMAVHLEKCLGEKLCSGILSVPVGIVEQFPGDSNMQLSKDSKIRVYQGAPNNEADQIAYEAAKSIKQLAGIMGPRDVLFVLISGGGSALLPIPRSPLTLDKKQNLIRTLSNKGASINEMNIVRIALSDIKGGRLAAAAKSAYAVISFIISDIVNDPVDLIASGPTCTARSENYSAKYILQKYNLWQGISEEIQRIVENDTIEPAIPNNWIHVVGNNKVATSACRAEGIKVGYNPVILTTSLQGAINDISKSYRILLEALIKFRDFQISEDDFRTVFPFDRQLFNDLIQTIRFSAENRHPILLIVGGEPTVEVKGSGVGGRNQELALKMALEFYSNPILANVCFLSGGTDGIDGPCPAAGAIGCKLMIDEFLKDHDLQMAYDAVNQNDSYTFFQNLCDGRFHLITGHTGTNVMDLHLILVP